MNRNPAIKPISHTPLEARLPVIKVIGLGGGGSNAVNRMIELGLTGVEFIAANTDAQALKNSLAPTRIHLGPWVTRGLGAGGNPSVGEAAAEESYKLLNQALSGADMVFLTAGMGGGTGTGSVPIVARVARSLGALTVAIVTLPFSFEMGRRQKNAREGLAKLTPHVDTLITVPNDRLLQIAQRDLPLDLAFRMADDVLRQGVQGISELITQPGLINVDFAHIKQLMQHGGGSFLSIGIGEGENKALKAIDKALNHPLLESIPLENATGIIANFTGGSDLTFIEVAEALETLQSRTNYQANIIPGVMSNNNLQNRVEVILVITGLAATPVEHSPRPVETAQPVPVARETIAAVPMPKYEPAQTTSTALPVNYTRSLPVEKPEVRELSPVEMSININDLDVPAFMRRRSR